MNKAKFYKKARTIIDTFNKAVVVRGQAEDIELELDKIEKRFEKNGDMPLREERRCDALSVKQDVLLRQSEELAMKAMVEFCNLMEVDKMDFIRKLVR